MVGISSWNMILISNDFCHKIKMYNFEPYNVLLSITTNIAVLLCFLLQTEPGDSAGYAGSGAGQVPRVRRHDRSERAGEFLSCVSPIKRRQTHSRCVSVHRSQSLSQQAGEHPQRHDRSARQDHQTEGLSFALDPHGSSVNRL